MHDSLKELIRQYVETEREKRMVEEELEEIKTAKYVGRFSKRSI